jgi:glycosyltransferase involved in cell wall biosynthesis
MSRPYCVISAPVLTASGYGSRARDLVKAIYELKKDEWDIEILSQRWGSTPMDYVDYHEEWVWIKALINQNGQLSRQPDYFFQLTIPSEFMPIGKLASVGFTAGIETTICDPSWLEGLNRMNFTVVSSNHAKAVFEASAFEKRDQQGRPVEQVKNQKPIKVLFEGVNTDKFYELFDGSKESELVKEINETVSEEFNFLLVGHWLQGEIGEDRKNIGSTIRTFLNAFKGKKNKPGLILKVSGGSTSIMDRDVILEKVDSIRKSVGSKDLPNVYLLHGDLEEAEMVQLYNHKKVKAMLFLTKGEGFGRPLLEFSLSKKPIIVSNWSGHLDFIHKDYSVLVTGELKNVHPSAAVQNMILQESMWFSYDEKDATEKIRLVYEKYNKYEELARRQAHHSKTNFSYERMKEELSKILEELAKPVTLKLPQLKKITLPEKTN